MTETTNYTKIYIPEVLSAKKNRTGYGIRGVPVGSGGHFRIYSQRKSMIGDI